MNLITISDLKSMDPTSNVSIHIEGNEAITKNYRVIDALAQIEEWKEDGHTEEELEDILYIIKA